MVAVQGQYHLAVAARLELVAAGIAAADVLMVVYLAVDGEHLFLVWREERLLARLGVYDAEALMAQYGRAAGVYAAPVGAAVTDFLAHAQSLLAQLRSLLLNVEDRYYSTHISFVFCKKRQKE